MAMAPRAHSSWVKSVRGFAWGHLPREPRLVAALWAGVIFLVGVILLSAALAPGRYELKTGQIAPEDIVATRAIVDRVATDRARQTAAAQVPDQYQIDPQTTSDAEATAAAVFAAIREAGAAPGSRESRETALSDACATYGVRFPAAAMEAAFAASTSTIDSLESQLRTVIETTMGSGVKREYLDAAKAQAGTRIDELGLTSGQESLLRTITGAVIVQNMEFNAAATQAKREEAMSAVARVEILKGQVIVRGGDIVHGDHLSVLQDLGLLRDRPAWGAVFGLALIMLLLEGAVVLYLNRFDRAIINSGRRLSLVCLLALLTIILAAVTRPFSAYFIPVATGTILMAILLDVRLATFMAFILGPFVGLMAGNDLGYAIVAVVGGLAGVYAVSRLGQRSDLIRAGLLVAAANAVAIAAVSNLTGRSLFELATLKDLLWGMGNGVASGVLAVGCLPFLEDVFGILTSVKLMELANPNQPLLRRLLMEAPGTYHHSIIVGNLAEAATAEVGGNTALVRVGAYYHDIGKARRPYFFVDNQFGGDSPHEKIAPSLSALIITSHVRDGVAMAEEANLPGEVVDLIQQHHGDSLVSYFYSRATENGDAESVAEEDFRYDGPLPQTREAAILMLADASEAAVRSLTKATPGRIEGVVRKVVKDRLDDGQLEHSPLTLQDLDRIAGIFSRVLAGIHHRRIEYPDWASDIRARGLRNGKAAASVRANGGKPANGGRPGNGGKPANGGRPAQGGRPGKAAPNGEKRVG